MKTTILKSLAALLAAVAIAACGSATEVGNPTGDAIERTIIGALDTSTLPDDGAAAKALEEAGAATIDPARLTVVAVAVEAGIESIEVPVDEAGGFTVQVLVGAAYDWEVRLGATTIGPFSFDQDELGHKAARLRITLEGPEIDMGLVRYENGAFVPENDPYRLQAGNGPQGPGGPAS